MWQALLSGVDFAIASFSIFPARQGPSDRHLHFGRALPLWRCADLAGRLPGDLAGGFGDVLEGRRRAAGLLRPDDGPGGLGAGDRHAGLLPPARQDHHPPPGARMGTALRHRRRRVRLAAGRLVPDRLRADRRPLCPAGQPGLDDRLSGRRFGPQFRQPRGGAGADPLLRPVHRHCAVRGWGRLPPGLRRAADRLLHQPEIHFRPAAPHADGRADRHPRDLIAGQPLRHRTQQHAARLVHVRRQPSCDGEQPPAGRDPRNPRRRAAARPLGARFAGRLRAYRHHPELGRRALHRGIRSQALRQAERQPCHRRKRTGARSR